MDPKEFKMKPMFLPDVENNSQPGGRGDLILQMRDSGKEYPQIWHLFAFRPEATNHLGAFTQEIMRGESPLTPGLRELIAAFTSAGNHCPF
jgi:alkylhydroperoxidase family enzyme